MGFFKRISDIVSANINDLVEGWEQPEKMLKQVVREMEATIEDSRKSVAKAMASEKLVAKELTENQRQATEWQARAEHAIEAGDDGLARKALVRKQEHEKLAAALLDQHTAALEASTTLRRQLDAMQAKLAEAKRRLGTLSARQKAAEVRSRVQLNNIDPKLNTDAFAKFDRLREKVERAEAEADALRELAADNDFRVDCETEINAADLELDAELIALKKKLQK
jgi:phage shock protein A